MAQTYTPVVLGKGVIEHYTGNRGQQIHNAPVIYVECGKCGYVNAIHRSSLLKRRAMVPTAQGKLVVRGFYCAKCKAVNSTREVNTAGLQPYTHTDAPTAQQHTDNNIQPTPSDNTSTAIAEQLTLLLDATKAQHLNLLNALNEVNTKLAALVELWSR